MINTQWFRGVNSVVDSDAQFCRAASIHSQSEIDSSNDFRRHPLIGRQ
jgi:hypothetical protein